MLSHSYGNNFVAMIVVRILVIDIIIVLIVIYYKVEVIKNYSYTFYVVI